MQGHKEWVLFAEADLKSARVLSKNELFGTSVYHAQQCAEKILKGYLAFKNQPIRRTHDLIELIELCKVFDGTFHALFDDAVVLKPYVTRTRYPSEYEIPDKGDAKVAIGCAKKIFDFVCKKISANEHQESIEFNK